MYLYNFIIFGAYFSLLVGNPFYYKELLKYSEFPFYNALLLTAISIPLSFLIMYASSGSYPFANYIMPPFQIFCTLNLLGFLYAISYSFTLFSFSICDLDCVVFYGLSSVVFDAIFEYAYFKQSISMTGAISLIIVICGMICTTFNFNWSLKHSLQFQLLISILSTFFCSYTKVLQVKVSNSISQMNEINSFSVVNFWKHLLSMVYLCIIFIIFDYPKSFEIPTFFEKNFLILIFFGVAMNMTLAILDNILSEQTIPQVFDTLVQMKLFTVLLICSASSTSIFSACSLCSSKFTLVQLFWIFVTIGGAITYTLSIDKTKVNYIYDTDSDMIALLHRNDQILNQNILTEK